MESFKMVAAQQHNNKPRFYLVLVSLLAGLQVIFHISILANMANRENSMLRCDLSQTIQLQQPQGFEPPPKTEESRTEEFRIIDNAVSEESAAASSKESSQPQSQRRLEEESPQKPGEEETTTTTVNQHLQERKLTPMTRPKPVHVGNESYKTYQKYQDEFGFPTKTPREMFGKQRLESCRVVFKDPKMATCHLGAFGGNFGDMLGPDIVKRAAEYYFGCDASHLRVVDFEQTNKTYKEGPCLWTVGSVWRYVRPHDHVFGTGMLGKESELWSSACSGFGRFRNVTVYSVRGPLTVEMVVKRCAERLRVLSATTGNYTTDLTQTKPAGDAGFLIPFLFPEYTLANKEDQKIPNCVVLHKYDEDTFKNPEKISHNNTKLLPVIQSWQTMVGNLTQCKVVSSSSLHGLIMADAFGIPARYIQRSSSVFPFKFNDYGRSFGIREDASKSAVILNDVLVHTDKLTVPMTRPLAYRAAYATQILESFPFHLLTTQQVS